MILVGDFNAEISDSHMDSFCAIYHLKSLIKEPTCYKNPDKPTCIDLILKNVRDWFIRLSQDDSGCNEIRNQTLFVIESASTSIEIILKRK